MPETPHRNSAAISETLTPQLAWSVAIQNRQAILWLAPGFRAAVATDELQPLLAALLVLPWGAIYSDTEDVDWGSLTTAAETRDDELVVRLFPDAAPTEKLPTNRLNI